MKFAKWMAMPFGRILRIAAGGVLVWVGLGPIGGTLGLVVAVVGLLPILAGLYNVCLIAPLIGVPFNARNLPKGGPPPAKPATPAGQH